MLSLPHNIYWHLPILIVLISLVYSATRFDEWGPIAVEAFRWGRNLLGFLAMVMAVLFVVGLFC
jgi:hypothetical protein